MHVSNTLANDVDVTRIKQIVNNRCVVCHGCYDAPCQLKLSSYDGLLRGATSTPVYNPSRLFKSQSTRLYIDGRTVSDWRNMGFHSVIDSLPVQNPERKSDVNPGNSVLKRFINQKQNHIFLSGKKLPVDFPLDINRELSCVTDNMADDFFVDHPMSGMPYGMAPLPQDEQKVLNQWIREGYPDFDPMYELPLGIEKQVAQWESFFNQSSPQHKLVSRYLYEHLFLGHLAISEHNKTYYYRLIRSSTPTGSLPDEIATRHPNNDPGDRPFFYRLMPIKSTLLDKTHLVYTLDSQRLERWNSLFFSRQWKIAKSPPYTDKYATNPFLTFESIPVEARYRFMLDDVHYFVNNFIKGPVCRGQVALNVINDYFFVAFLSPEYDLSVVDDNYLKNALELLDLPLTTVNPLNFAEVWHEGFHTHRNYLQYRDRAYKSSMLTKRGLPIEAIWDGDQKGTALLTVFRHFDSASVSDGFIGGNIPDTAWVIDYPTLERIYYDLVVTFDVFGSVSHQMLTRMYMDYLRMESEGLFLSFLPLNEREKILEHWYRGAFAQAKIFYGHTNLLIDTPALIQYKTKNVKDELIAMIKSHSNQSLHDSPSDRPAGLPTGLRMLDGSFANNSPWIQFLPELSLILIHNQKGEIEQVVSMIVNKAHENVSFIFGESNRRLPAEDTVMLANGIIGSYPNFIFWVANNDLVKFSKLAKKVDSSQSMDKWIKRFGVRRTDDRIWSILDRLNQYRMKHGQGEALLDISRYENL